MRVLNYAPGPLSTDMYDEICRTCGDEKITQMFNASKEEVSVTAEILEILLVEFGILGFRVQNTAQGIWNPRSTDIDES